MEIDKNRVAKNIAELDKTYELSALMNVDSFFYALFDQDALLYSKQIKLKEQVNNALFDGEELAFSKVHVGMSSERFTLVPAEDYDITVRAQLLEHALGAPSTTHVFSDYNPIAKVYICYDLTQELYDRCTQLSENVQINHIVSVLLSNLLKESESTLMHLCKIGKQTVIIFLVNGQLKLVTNLQSSSPMQILYYTNLLREQFDKKEEDIQIQLSGDFRSSDGTISLLKKYFSQVSYKQSSLTFNDLGITSSLHYPLKSIAECG